MWKMQFKFLFLILGSFLISNDALLAQSDKISETTTPSVFNAELAVELEADEYGMSRYVMALLKKGPNRTTDEEEAAKLQAAHMANIGRLMEAGKLSMAGPFLDDGELRGIYIFNVSSVEEARALTETDPAIQAGSLVMELHPWYATAALKRLIDLHPETAKKSF